MDEDEMKIKYDLIQYQMLCQLGISITSISISCVIVLIAAIPLFSEAFGSEIMILFYVIILRVSVLGLIAFILTVFIIIFGRGKFINRAKRIYRDDSSPLLS